MSKSRIVVLSVLIAIVMLIPSAAYALPAGKGPATGLSAEEKAVLSQIDYAYAWSELEYLSSLGEEVTGAEVNSQQYVYDVLSALPLDAVVWEPFPTHRWIHHGTTLKVVSPVTEEIEVTTYGDSFSVYGIDEGKPYYFGNSPDGKTLTAELVYAGYGTKAEFDALGDLNGKIALVKRDDSITYWPNVMLEEARLHGASACIFYHYYGTYPLPDGIKQDAVGGSIPAFSISDTSALHLLELLAKGPVTVSVTGSADLVSEKKGKSANVVAYLYGETRPDEYVIFSGHIDRWWWGTNDDLSAVASVLEYARLFSTLKAQGKFVNDRTMVFASFGGEELGGPRATWYNWLIGSYEFVKAHEDIVSKTVVDLNLDMCSLKKTSGRNWVEQSPELNEFVMDAVGDLGLTGAVGYYNPVYSWIDAWSFQAKAGVSAASLNWVDNQDATYHTQLDNMELADPETLKIALDLWVVLGIRADHALVLPINMMNTLNWVESYLSAGMTEAPSLAAKFNEVKASLAELKNTVSLANAYAADLQAAYDKAISPSKKAVIKGLADDLNDALYRARKIINVWTYGEGGVMGSWDVFVRPHQHSHDLKLVNDAIAALERNRVNIATKALESVYTMEWGKLFSRETYLIVMGWMINDEMYWGGEWDQQQAYVDVQLIYFGLKDKTMPINDAISALKDVRDGQLIPWLVEDLEALWNAYNGANAVLGEMG
ncbi:MAG: M28 family peptidase [Thermoplasmata archaeon]